MLAATAELKPVFAETYSAYVKAEGWKTRGEATKLLETAYTALMSCEGELRRTTGVLRGLDPKRVAGRDTRNDPGPLIGPAQYEELGRAWQHYLAALENLGDATVRAAKLCDEWARKSTMRQAQGELRLGLPGGQRLPARCRNAGLDVADVRGVRRAGRRGRVPAGARGHGAGQFGDQRGAHDRRRDDQGPGGLLRGRMTGRRSSGTSARSTPPS